MVAGGGQVLDAAMNAAPAAHRKRKYVRPKEEGEAQAPARAQVIEKGPVQQAVWTLRRTTDAETVRRRALPVRYLEGDFVRVPSWKAAWGALWRSDHVDVVDAPPADRPERPA